MDQPVGAFLGVGASVTGRRWVGLDPAAMRLAERIAQETGQPEALCRTLARLGVLPEAVAGYLAPKLRDLLPDPRDLKDMEPAAGRFLTALRRRERVAIFADYDVDGGASAALLLTWLRALGRPATLYIPDRIDEGYGPNVPAMQALARDHDLIICVDCGTLSHEPIAAAQGADVIVLDHHLGAETLPPAIAVVNPNRQDEDGAHGTLCAAGVVFLMLVEVNRQMRAAGETGPDLMALLDLVALATVADVAPLTGLNRALVRQGLAVMKRRGRAGLVALGDIARLETPPTPYTLGFVFGPRVNAGGRIGAADLGARLLSTADPHEAAALAEKLDQLNTERQELEKAVREAALAQAEGRGLDAPLVWAAEAGWHPGVVGIVAARLKEATNRPAVVIGFDGTAGKGSGRSVAGVDLGAAIQRLARDGLIEKGGGHRMAAGLSLDADQLEPAMARLSELLERQGAGQMGPADLRCDAPLLPGAATPELVEHLEAAGPFGAGAPAPRFAFPDVRIAYAKRMGREEAHLRLGVSDGMGATLEAVLFNAFATPMGAFLEARRGARAHLAGRLDLNHFGGRSRVQLRIEDAAEPV